MKLIEGIKVKLILNDNSLYIVPLDFERGKFSRKTIGVLGGMGPEASADLYFKIIKFCQKKYKAKLDEDYPPMVIYNLPAPQMIDGLKNKDELFKLLLDGIKKLELSGTDFIVIACNTVHYFLQELRKNSTIPILSIVEEVAKKVKAGRFKKVGLLATTTTVKQKLYDKVFDELGMSLIVPNKNYQGKVIRIIRNVISGKILQKDKQTLEQIINALKSKNVEGIILGCTDLPIILRECNSDIEIFDSTNILAEAATDIAYGDHK